MQTAKAIRFQGLVNWEEADKTWEIDSDVQCIDYCKLKRKGVEAPNSEIEQKTKEEGPGQGTARCCTRQLEE